MQKFKCGNCRALIHGGEVDDEDMGEPICPDCGVEPLTEMTVSECVGCGGTEFQIIQRAEGESVTGADPTAKCAECGRSAEVDDDGLWW